VILGADKWAQVLDPAFYGGSRSARDAAVARLPLVVLARRPPSPAVFGAGSASGDGADPAPGARSTPGPWPESGGSDGAGAVGSGGARTLILEVPAAEGVSSTGARAGRRAWMAPEAREFDRRTGAWSDADRYRRWLARSESEVSVTGDRVAKQASEQRR
ncbi:MAG: hypothetical protein ACRD0J_11125, partial [Acidimicrobiales bacterium]